MFFDPVYLLFALPGLVIALAASFYTKSTFSKYSQVEASSRLSGAEAAKRMLQVAGIYDVKIEVVSGFMTDHYDPTSKTLRLSPAVFSSKTLSAVGVACHEAGHAIQHARAYAPLKLRTVMVPLTNICTTMSYFIILLGFVMSKEQILIGAILFSVAVLFSIITLPVEWNASARAKEMLVTAGIVTPMEANMSGQVLNAAFLTYVAAAVTALLTLLYYLLRAGVFGSRNE